MIRMGNQLGRGKRMMTILLSAAMLLTSSSVTAFAENVSDDIAEEVVVEEVASEEALEEATGVEIVETAETVAAEESVAAEAVAEETEAEDEAAAGKTEAEVVTALDAKDFVSDYDQFNAKIEYSKKTKEVAVKLTWKPAKDYAAKSYKLYRLNDDGVFDSKDVQLLDGKQVNKKSFVDLYAFKNEQGAEVNFSGVYLLEAYSDKDNGGSVVGRFVTIPRAEIISAQYDNDSDAAKAGNVKVTFNGFKGAYKYVIESCEKKNFRSSVTVCSAAFAPTDADRIKVLGRDAVQFVDTDRLVTESNRYYRVSAFIDLKGLRVETKPSDAVNAKAYYKVAPTIVSITNGDEKHPLCYGKGYIYTIVDTKGDYPGGKNKDYTFEIQRAKADGKWVTVRTIELRRCDQVTFDGVANVYKIPYDEFSPEITYDYRVRYMYKKDYGPYSDPYTSTCHFEDTVTFDDEDPYKFSTTSSVKLKWVADDCARSYEVWRTKDSLAGETKEEALEQIKSFNEFTGEMNTKALARLGFTKVGRSVNNKVDGQTISFDDKKVKKSAHYYNYFIVPVNGNERGIYNAGILTVRSDLGQVKNLKATPDYDKEKNMCIKLTWSSVLGCSYYLVERTEVSSMDEEPDFTKAVVVEKRRNTQCNCTDYTAAPEKLYAYRIAAVNEANSKRGELRSYSEDYVYAKLQTLAPTGLKATPKFTKNIINKTLGTGFNGKIEINFREKSDADDNDHYDLVWATEESEAAFNQAVVSADDACYKKVDVEKSGYTQKITFSNMKRGVDYFFAVRPVSKSGIKGVWQNVELCLPISFSLESANPTGDKRNGHGTSTSTGDTYYETEKDKTEKIIVKFYPEETTYKELGITSDDFLDTEYNADKVIKINGVEYSYIKVTAKKDDKKGYINVKGKNYGDSEISQKFDTTGKSLFQRFYIRTLE